MVAQFQGALSTCSRGNGTLTIKLHVKDFYSLKSSYVNSDYALSNAIKRMKRLKEIVLSYDIVCQYSKNLHARFDASPFLETFIPRVHHLIPKFHAPGHKEDCRFRYSFNYMKGVGRTDGEGIECFWSPHNHLSSSTSKMNGGFRLDTLNTHFQDWNVRKARKMGEFQI